MNADWVKGVSGNPSGRPKMNEALKKTLRDGAEDAVRVWREILINPEEKSSDRNKAGELIFSYAYGKPIQQVAMEGNVTATTIDAGKLSKDQKDAIIALAAQSFTAADDASTD